MQIIIILIITIFLFFVIALFESGSIFEIYGQEDLVIDEKVDIIISKDNETLIVPAKIGIEPGLWKDHSLDYYSVDPNRISPLNTKNYNGTIHINSIRDREFTLENFLDVWGFDKSKIKNVFCNEKIICNINLILTDGQNLKIQIKQENVFYENFTKYNDTKITFDYPSQWTLTNYSTPLQGMHTMTLRNNTIFPNLIKLYPNEAEYMTTPLFSILINKLDSNRTDIDNYYKQHVFNLFFGLVNAVTTGANYTVIEIDDNLAYKIYINTTLVAQSGSLAIGNNITQYGFHIWTIQNDYFYDISFKAFENIYNKYYPIVNKIIKSIRFQ